MVKTQAPVEGWIPVRGTKIPQAAWCGPPENFDSGESEELPGGHTLPGTKGVMHLSSKGTEARRPRPVYLFTCLSICILYPFMTWSLCSPELWELF